MGTLSRLILLICILGKGGGGGRRRNKRKVKRHCENCGEVIANTGSSNYRCQNCSPDSGEAAKAAESLVEQIAPAGPDGDGLAG
jgi:hypothetical protein